MALPLARITNSYAASLCHYCGACCLYLSCTHCHYQRFLIARDVSREVVKLTCSSLCAHLCVGVCSQCEACTSVCLIFTPCCVLFHLELMVHQITMTARSIVAVKRFVLKIAITVHYVPARNNCTLCARTCMALVMGKLIFCTGHHWDESGVTWLFNGFSCIVLQPRRHYLPFDRRYRFYVMVESISRWSCHLSTKDGIIV